MSDTYMRDSIETSNMIIMILAHARVTGDTSLILTYVRVDHIIATQLQLCRLVLDTRNVGRLSGRQHRPSSQYRVCTRGQLHSERHNKLMEMLTRQSIDGDYNSANLQIKGIIAIKAMSQICAVANQFEAAQNYSVLGFTWQCLVHALISSKLSGHGNQIYAGMDCRRICRRFARRC